MSKTMADHARSYRQRRAKKMARMEAALRESLALAEDPDVNEMEALLRIYDITKAALNPGKEMGE